MSDHRNEKRPIIVKRKVAGHSAHHGGSWKVAYADFVTAMMAFFMVMWIMGMDPQAKDLIQGYFQNPVGFKKGFGAGQNPLSAGNAMQHEGLRAAAISLRSAQQASFNEMAERIRLRLAEDEQLKALRENFEIKVTNEGLRIELIDAGKGDAFFALGSPEPRDVLKHALQIIGRELIGLPNPVILEGHTDAYQYGSARYTNWELSADRANAARKLLLLSGLEQGRIHEIRGMADRELRIADQPYNPANRRVSIMIPFVDIGPKVPGLTEETGQPAAPAISLQSVSGATPGAGHEDR